MSSSGSGPRDSGLNPIGAARVEPPPSARVLDSQQPSGSGEGKGQSSGPRKSDRAIFRKIVASQRTAALAGVDTQDMIWNEMRKDAEMECRKVRRGPGAVRESGAKCGNAGPRVEVLVWRQSQGRRGWGTRACVLICVAL